MRSLERSIRRALVGAIALGLGISACKETVTEPIAVAAVVVTGGGGNLRLGQSVQLSTTLKSTEGWTLPNVGVSWTSSDAAKANISPSGQVTAVSRGPVTLTASAGGVNGTAAVTVIGVQSISLAPETLSVIVTQTRAMTATTVLDPGVTVTPVWRSLDTTIARVDTAGRITARTTTGFARVEVTAEDKKDTAVVRVIPVPVASLTVSPATATLTIGANQQLTATPRDSVGGILTGRTVTWSSSDTARATVSSTGLVTAKAAGSATITAAIESKLGSSSLVVLVPVAKVQVNPEAVTLLINASQQLVVKTQDSTGLELSNRVVSWQSSDTTTATVSSGGVVTAKKVGTATITATSEGVGGSSAITVKESPGIRAVIKGPRGTGLFYIRISGTNNATDRFVRLVAEADSGVLSFADQPGNSYTLRVYAADARTDNQKTVGGWVRVIGIGRKNSVIVGPTYRTEVAITAPEVALKSVQAPDSVDAFSAAAVTWQVYDSTGMIRELSNHHLNVASQPWDDAGIGPGRRTATQAVDAQSLLTFTASISGQEIDGVRYWQMVHWDEFVCDCGPLRLSMKFPSLINSEALKQLKVLPVQQGLQLSLRAPARSGSLFLNIIGPGVPQGIWRRITSVTGDTASLRQMLPPGEGYQVRLVSVDAQTDPERTVGGWVAINGVGRRSTLSVAAGQFTPISVQAHLVNISNVIAPDSVATGKSASISWETTDTTGILNSFANKHIGYAAGIWEDGQIGPGRVDGQAELNSADRYRYSAAIPAQTVPQMLAWKIAMWEEVGGLFGGNRLALFAPSTSWRAESPRYIKVFSPPAVATVVITPSAKILSVGASQQLIATLKDSNLSNLSDRDVTWTTSNNAVATVSNTGLVTARSAGSVIITATSEGKSGNATLTTIAPINVFDGTRYFEAPQSGPIGSNPRTVAYWVKTSKQTTMGVLAYGATNQSGAGNAEFLVNLNVGYGAASGYCAQIDKGPSFYSLVHAVTFNKPIADSTWHHVAYVFGAGGSSSFESIQIYVDGALISHGANKVSNCGHNWGGWSYQTEEGPIRIGSQLGDNFRSTAFVGEIRNVAIWGRALSGEEISQLRIGLPSDVPTGLRNHWPIDVIQIDNKVLDIVGGNHAVLRYP